MMSTSTVSRSNKFPFTATQWQELEHQALIYKYMVAGIPIPPDLLFSISRNQLDPPSNKLFPAYQTSPIGWNPYQMGMGMGMGMGYGGKKIDPEPGRCRRTDGKKWRCSKEAYADSKYCERHMHRGKNRSRKPVEVVLATTPAATQLQQLNSTTKLPNNVSSSSSGSSFQSASDASNFHYGNYHLYPHHSSSSRPPGSSGSCIDQDTHLLYDSSASFSRDRYFDGVKDDVGAGEHAFFTETSGATRGSSLASSMDNHQAWQQQQHQQQGHTKLLQGGGYPYLELKTDIPIPKQEEKLQMHTWGRDLASSEASSSMPMSTSTSTSNHHEPRKTIHHFFDEWPPKGSRDYDSSSTIQLSISMPTSSHDFFLSSSAPHNHNDG